MATQVSRLLDKLDQAGELDRHLIMSVCSYMQRLNQEQQAKLKVILNAVGGGSENAI